MEPNEYNVAINHLKLRLKEKKISYSELAKGIGLSESGIKKIFAAGDTSFLRLVQICTYAGLSLAEIVDDRRQADVIFSERQQEQFLNEPILFQFYWMLVYERRSLQAVQKELRLNKVDAFKIARKLDQLDLIKLLPGDRINIPSVRAVRWVGQGKFLSKLYREWSYKLIDNVAKPVPLPEELFIIRYQQMTKKTYSEFMAAQKALEDEFVRRSIQEMQNQGSDLRHVRWIVAADNKSFVE